MSRMDFNKSYATIEDLPNAVTIKAKTGIIFQEFKLGNITEEEAEKHFQGIFNEFSDYIVDVSKYRHGYTKLPQKEELIVTGLKLAVHLNMPVADSNNILQVDREQMLTKGGTEPSKGYKGPWIIRKIVDFNCLNINIIMDNFRIEEDSYDEEGRLKNKEKVITLPLNKFLKALPSIIPEDNSDFKKSYSDHITNPADDLKSSDDVVFEASKLYSDILHRKRFPIRLNANKDIENNRIKGDFSPRWYVKSQENDVHKYTDCVPFLLEPKEESIFLKELRLIDNGETETLLTRRVYIPGTVGTIECIMRPIGFTAEWVRNNVKII